MSKHIIVVLISFFLFSSLCSEKSVSVEDPHKLFSSIETTISENYVLKAENADFHIPGLYGKAYESITGTKKESSSIDEVSGLISAISDSDEKAKKMTAAARAMLESLPIGTNQYYPPLSIAYSSDPDRKGGVGLVVRELERGVYMIVDSIEGSASHRERVQIGQKLLEVDGKPVDTMDLDEVVGRIRGPIDSSVTLKLSEQEVTLIRASVPFSNLRSNRWRYNDGFAYVFQLRSTLPGTAKELKDAIMQSKNMKTMILDIRKVNYGNFKEAFKVADLVRTGKENKPLGGVYMRGSGLQMFEPDEDELFNGKIYVLVDRLASPVSEVLALALSESDDVVLIGQKLSGQCFLSQAKPTDAGGEIRIAEGYVVTADRTPFYESGLAVDYKVDQYLPFHPPFDRPDPSDPAHQKLAELLDLDIE